MTGQQKKFVKDTCSPSCRVKHLDFQWILLKLQKKNHNVANEINATEK